MAFMRDPDALHRGVGAIAASDGVAGKRRVHRRAALARVMAARDRARAKLTYGVRGGVGDDYTTDVVYCGYNDAQGKPVVATTLAQCPPKPMSRITGSVATTGTVVKPFYPSRLRPPGAAPLIPTNVGGGLAVPIPTTPPGSTVQPGGGTVTTSGGSSSTTSTGLQNPGGGSVIGPTTGGGSTTGSGGSSGGLVVTGGGRRPLRPYNPPYYEGGAGGGTVTGVVQTGPTTVPLPPVPDLPAQPSSGSFLDSIPDWAKLGGAALALCLLLKGRS